ncbi:hypothetical protein [Flavobacterium aquicola]|uniref:Lipoprotein n=1 Tax=Flavobacterium aquicola TaxID=1682742 RepID=A0A3E0EIB1_9FLAO|nr:hypothetical protein [Flavobacterium aquicola]REG97992.1 hypothetical protein C8P67_108158 [Flavobacterium aquicola]
MKHILLLVICMLVSCKKENGTYNKKENSNIYKMSSLEKDFHKSNYFNEERIKRDKFLVTSKGDNLAYSELELYYSYNNLRKDEILPYSLMMVEKFKKYKYCTNLFEDFLEFYSGKSNNYDGTEKSLIDYLGGINKLDESQKRYLIYFLNIGAKNNDFGSVRYLEIIYRNGLGVSVNTKSADSLKSCIKEKFPAKRGER